MSLVLRPSLFWDTDINDMDQELYKVSIIERTTLRGTWEEFKAMVRFYGHEQVGQILKDIRWLDRKTHSFCSVFFNIPEKEFRCYKFAQLHPEHWDY